MNSGKLVILIMLGVGCAMAGLAISYHYSVSRRSIAWWGMTNVSLIKSAPEVSAFRVAKDTASSTGDATGVAARTAKSLVGWPGIDHLRHGLLEDQNFLWSDDGRAAESTEWVYGLVFKDGPTELVVLFNADATRLCRSDTKQTLDIAPHSRGWHQLFDELNLIADSSRPPETR